MVVGWLGVLTHPLSLQRRFLTSLSLHTNLPLITFAYKESRIRIHTSQSSLHTHLPATPPPPSTHISQRPHTPHPHASLTARLALVPQRRTLRDHVVDRRARGLDVAAVARKRATRGIELLPGDVLIRLELLQQLLQLPAQAGSESTAPDSRRGKGEVRGRGAGGRGQRNLHTSLSSLLQVRSGSIAMQWLGEGGGRCSLRQLDQLPVRTGS
eukprot:360895-Chlamydomonas_euryale.AAC.3